ncbi:GGDEF domain-containing protein [Peredibacter starrii]|uniref:Diguanylate cyclase n=1 Tax=Peredibacter starrii TaxID=28202 RepID=A0AAX4HTH5_9BACT|nr:diguanylate cyclase [Peredibacter starrii]WPU66473.1 diguanylate cyclase [Peredibacter starrii]
MIKFILLFIISFSAFAQMPNCPELYPFSEVQSLSTAVTETAEKACVEKDKDEGGIVDLAWGCLTGGGNAVVGAITGFIDILKLLLVDAPVWVWGEAKEKITKLVSGELSPGQMASAIASINLSSQSSIWDKAVDYWKAFKKFASELKDNLVTEIKGFPCLPLKKQSEIVCRGVSEVFLLYFAPVKFIQGAKWTINTGKALKTFVTETKAMNGLGEANLADRLKLAQEALRKSKSGNEILKMNNARLIETELPTGEKILQYEQMVTGKDGKLHKIVKDVPVDGKTHAIDANSAIGKEIMSEMVKANAGNGSLIFVDVNHLGKVNYFKRGTQGGDDYLENVAESLRKSLRPGDIVFKNGGDELVVVVGTNKPEVVKNISQRMINEVDQNPRVRQLFKQEVIDLSQKYKGVNKAKSWEELPDAVRNNLTEQEELLAKKSFAKFQDQKKKEILAEAQEQSTYRGSISVGSSLVKEQESLADVLQRAEKQAAEVKARYKATYGHDVSKYKLEVEVPVTRRGAPIALEPN